MAEVVLWELDFLAVDLDLTVLDAVGIAADGCSEVRGRVLDVGILLDIVEAENHILRIVILVGHHDGNNTSTEIGDAHFHSVGVLQRVECHGLFIDYCVESCRVES